MLDINRNINGLRRLGINKATRDFEKVKIEIVNNVCLLAMVGWLINNFLINFLASQYLDILITVPLFLSFTAPLYLNKINKPYLARIILIVLVSFSLSTLYFAVGTRNYYEFLFLLLFILILYLIEDNRSKVSLSIFVLLTWLVPYLYTTINAPISSSQKVGVIEIIFIGSMIAIYLISKKTVDQINALDFKQEDNIIQQKKVLDMITFHNKELEAKGAELLKKNNEIEIFFKMSSDHLKSPTKKLISLSKKLEASLNCENTTLAKELFSIINQSAIRMNELIEAVFEYSAISKDSPKEIVDCNQILKEIFDDIQNTIKTSKAKIECCDLPSLLANKVEIRMLFLNLISNSIKYSKKKVKPVIKIDVKHLERYWQFSLADNGIGIDKIHQSNVFNMFHKLHNNEEYAGSGIGLSHCKKIVNLLGGDIWVESEPGFGTTVFFTCLKAEHLH